MAALRAASAAAARAVRTASATSMRASPYSAGSFLARPSPDRFGAGLSAARALSSKPDGWVSPSSELVRPMETPDYVTPLETGYKDDYHNAPHFNTRGDPTKRAFTYLVLGSSKFIAASAARVLILKLIYTMSASADVLAKGSVEVELGSIPLGESATIKWRGKPVFIRHRTPEEISLAAKDDQAELRDPQLDSERSVKPEWLVLLGVCTHLGCVPIANAGDYHGWFCPCHGSHYDVSGRIRKGPAPLNLEVPTYSFIEDDTKLLLGGE